MQIQRTPDISPIRQRAVAQEMELLTIREALEEGLRLAEERYQMSILYQAVRKGEAHWTDIEGEVSLVDAQVAFTLRQILRSGFESFQTIFGVSARKTDNQI